MARAPQVDKKAARAQRAPEAAGPRAVALDLAPLLQPYKKHGRLSVRIERLPQRARLSGGHKNGDGSWSLTTDELEDLKYFVPEGAESEHALAIRVISLDRAGGHTLALLDFPISPNVARCGTACEDEDEAIAPAPVNGAAAPAADDTVNLLRDELLKMKATLAAHESQLAETRQKTDLVEAKVSDQTTEAALAAARTAFEGELAARLAEAEARAKADLQKALAKAQEAWKSEEAARLATAEAEWRAASQKALAEARAAAARDPSADAAMKALREQIATLEARLAEREAAVAKAEGAARQGQEALSKAERALEAARGAAATRDEGVEAERNALREAVATLKANLVTRDAALAEAEKAAAALRERAPQEAHQALAQAEENWRAAEAARLAAAEAQWRAALEKAVADARAESEAIARAAQEKAVAAARAEALAARGDEQVEFRALHDKLAQLQTTLVDREAALSRAEKALAEAAERGQRELHAALSKAAKTHKADEAARLTTAQAEWRKQSAQNLNQALARAEAAETALAQIRLKGTPKLDSRTETEIGALRASLAAREEEVAHLRATLERHRLAEFDQDTAHGGRAAERGAAHSAPDNRRFTRDIVIAAVVGVVAVLGYPLVDGLITGGSAPVREAALPAAPETEPPAPPPPAPAALRMAETVKDANLRAEPAKSGALVAKVPRGAAVAVVEERGNWLRVRLNDDEGEGPTEGWVYASLLKDAPPPSK